MAMQISILERPAPYSFMTEAQKFLSDSTMAICIPAVMGGYAMGFLFSLFGSVMRAETSTQVLGAKDFFKYSIRSGHQLGGGFAFFGFIFTGIEIALEKRRGKKDMWNPTASGALIGGFYGLRSYRTPGLVGGFAAGGAFSLLFEYLMHHMGFAQV